MTQSPLMLHATCVAVDGRGVLIIGTSGAGKSSLALRMIALGAVLVADDQTCLARDGTDVIASVPQAIAGMIEARAVGLIHTDHAGPTKLYLVIDLSRSEGKRLPADHIYAVAGTTLPCLHKSENAYFPEAIMLYLRDKQRFPDAQR